MSLVCPNCHHSRIAFQTRMEKKETTTGMIVLYVILAITVLGLFILIPILLTHREEPVTYAICQNCGFCWRVEYVSTVFPDTAMYNTIYCTHCGAPNDLNAKFCVKCGRRIIS